MKSVSVLGTRYKIKVIDLTQANAYGLCCKDKKIILIDKKLKGEEYSATLLHEIGHAIFKESGLNQTSIESDIEEIIVENFAKIICQTFDLKPKRKCT